MGTEPDAQALVVAVPEQIRRHARSVAGFADAAQQCQRAAAYIAVDDDSYGQLCAFMPRILGGLQDRLAAAMQAAALELETTGDALRMVADNYEGADEHARLQHVTVLAERFR